MPVFPLFWVYQPSITLLHLSPESAGSLPSMERVDQTGFRQSTAKLRPKGGQSAIRSAGSRGSRAGRRAIGSGSRSGCGDRLRWFGRGLARSWRSFGEVDQDFGWHRQDCGRVAFASMEHPASFHGAPIRPPDGGTIQSSWVEVDMSQPAIDDCKSGFLNSWMCNELRLVSR